MQIHAVLFVAAQIAVSGYAWVRGGAPERVVAVELLVAALVNWLIPVDPSRSFRGVEWAALVLDTGLLVALLPVALCANRYWPMWITAVQLDAIAIHGVRGYDPALRAAVYELLSGKAAYFILIILAAGTLRHRDREANVGKREASWIFGHDR